MSEEKKENEEFTSSTPTSTYNIKQNNGLVDITINEGGDITLNKGLVQNFLLTPATDIDRMNPDFNELDENGNITRGAYEGYIEHLVDSLKDFASKDQVDSAKQRLKSIMAMGTGREPKLFLLHSVIQNLFNAILIAEAEVEPENKQTTEKKTAAARAEKKTKLPSDHHGNVGDHMIDMIEDDDDEDVEFLIILKDEAEEKSK
mmetsp:Transcript_11042/g.16575  ORF Transcript_11042/g.16575 Transcript_11042/m.16575 type:complete len:203 (+) Transcript_11042:70-678(+)